MSILLLTHDHHVREYRHQQLFDRLNRAGVEAIPCPPDHLVVHWTGTHVQIFDQAGHRLNPQLVVNALYRSDGKGLEIVAALDALGYPVINSAAAWLAAKVKTLTTAHLIKAGIPHPQTLFTMKASTAFRRWAVKQIRRPVVSKPWRGALGIGVTRFRTRKGLRRRLRRKGTQVYLQRYVHHPGRDIRVLIIGDQPAGATYRVVRRGRWKTNVHSGARPVRCSVTPELGDLALKATRALNLDIAGVDIIEGRQGLQVLEVNAWPNYFGFDRVARVDVAQKLTEYFLYRLAHP